ncbi:MAG: ACT domain-containing protein [Pseudomonadota bacterium]
MSGETDLDVLIASMEPVLDPATYVFLTVDTAPDGLEALMTFQEAEGLTLIAKQGAVKAAGLDGVFPCRRITLNVHSALEAVGFIARIATHLAAAGMGVNPVAGYYHDHLFVPADRAEEAMALLANLSKASA